MTILPTKILALDQPNDIEVEQVFVGTGPSADAQPAKIPFPTRFASGCHAALFMDK